MSLSILGTSQGVWGLVQDLDLDGHASFSQLGHGSFHSVQARHRDFPEADGLPRKHASLEGVHLQAKRQQDGQPQRVDLS